VAERKIPLKGPVTFTLNSSEKGKKASNLHSFLANCCNNRIVKFCKTIKQMANNHYTVGLFIIPRGQNNTSEPKSKSSKKGIVFMIKGPK
jgi:hypothetical protein